MHLIGALVGILLVAQTTRDISVGCRVASNLLSLPYLPEASGIASSLRHPGVLWAHNDSGAPVIFALGTDGSVKKRVRVAGATVQDWEDLGVGPCPDGSCVYIGDIGDNNGSRSRITLYRIPEPSLTEDVSRPAEVFFATYPDGPRDAEAIFVTEGPGVFVVTKGGSGGSAIYRFPDKLRAGATVQLQRIGKPINASQSDNSPITGGAASADGQWVVLRTHRSLVFYRFNELLKGTWHEYVRVPLGNLGERQGEGVALARDNTVYLVGEGGARLRAGTFIRLSCAWKP